jgi:transmembrane sensor
MSQEDENNLYARWLNDELSQEEKSLLKQNGDDEILGAIVSAVDEWSLPEVKDETFEKIHEKISAKKEAKVIPLHKKMWVYAAAATIILAVGLVWMLNPGQAGGQVIELSCVAGETRTFTLPDNTSITLYGRSKVVYDKTDFAKERKLNLEGEGYFEVNQKGDFVVNYNAGSVHVLGTKFDVLAGEDIASVKCFEGKVEVEMSGEKSVLGPGNGTRKINKGKIENFSFENNSPLEISTETRFENTPLHEVCASLSLYYDISIDKGNASLDRNFTGRFTKSNLDTALAMVFDPMGIAVSKDGKTITLRNK